MRDLDTFQCFKTWCRLQRLMADMVMDLLLAREQVRKQGSLVLFRAGNPIRECWEREQHGTVLVFSANTPQVLAQTIATPDRWRAWTPDDYGVYVGNFSTREWQCRCEVSGDLPPGYQPFSLRFTTWSGGTVSLPYTPEAVEHFRAHFRPALPMISGAEFRRFTLTEADINSMLYARYSPESAASAFTTERCMYAPTIRQSPTD